MCWASPRGTLELEKSQAAAAVGQISLAGAYQAVFKARGLAAAQILLTLGDTEERRRYLNARQTIDTLLGRARHARRQRERHGGDRRDPLRRQRPPLGPRRQHDERRLPGAAVRRRRPLHRAARQRQRRAARPRGAPDHARDRGDGGRRGQRALPRRHGDQDRGGQDRAGLGHAHGHHLGHRGASLAAAGGGCALHLAAGAVRSRDRAQALDRRPARAQGAASRSTPGPSGRCFPARACCRRA